MDKNIKVRQVIREEIRKVLKEEYYRLEDKKGKDYLYTAYKDLKQLYESVIEHGNDFDMRLFKNCLFNLDALKNTIKKYQ